MNKLTFQIFLKCPLDAKIHGLQNLQFIGGAIDNKQIS
jgi:hypothetical protein